MADNLDVRIRIELERETDGRWIADIPSLPGVMAYGDSREMALDKVQVLALRVLADQIEHGEAGHLASFEFEAA
jgi:predicted RNase H-like HicB family nuclease